MQLLSILSVLGLVTANYKLEKLPSGRIVGGYEVTPKFQYPWIASLEYYGSHTCGGTLYNEKTIISAAHCNIGSTSAWSASVHRHDLNEKAEKESGSNHKIIERISHPQYDLNDDSSNDVSVWKIAAPGNKTSGIVLDSGKVSSEDGTLLKVIGWGTTTSGGDVSKVLLEVKVPVFNIDKCKKAYSTLDTASQFCAGYPEGGKDSCQGDSGGPIFIEEKGVATLVGVVSWGRGCALKGYPGVYTRVSKVLDFIEKHAN
uniref:Trypsin-like serine protease n=1 Tax=Zoophthora radicans TaxID=42210 RepID=Q5I8R5_9FUNG|nr:trypsin-like serine protease [Zoophthora radicans]